MFGAVVGLFCLFLARDDILCLALYMLSPVHRSICLSVYPSHGYVDQSKMAEVRVTQFSAYYMSSFCLVSFIQKF